MKLAQLRTLIKKGESETLEFKSSTGSLSTGMQTVCAFLNSEQGGTVIFGVTDNGKLVGQEITDKHLKALSADFARIEPHTNIKVDYVKVEKNRQAIVLKIEPGERAPYSYDGRAYIRRQSTTVQMPREVYLYLHNKNNPTQWEGLTNTYKVSDLDHHKIKEIVQIAIAKKRLLAEAATAKIPDLLRKLNLMIGEKLTNAAVILFGKSDKIFMQSSMQLARFKGIDKTAFLDTKYLRANAFDLYDAGLDFLHFSLPVAAYIEPGNPERVEIPAIPYNVLREAITNALIHRDYSNPGGTIHVAIYDDRVNITNFGALPKGLSLNKLSREHASVPRNPLIAHIFFICGKIEKWGRGTLDMIKDSKQAGNPPPQFEEIGDTFSITFPLKEPLRGFVMPTQQQQSTVTLTARQKKIISMLEAGALSRQDLMEKLKTPLTSRAMQLELSRLQETGLIKKIGKAKSILWTLTRIAK